MKLYILSLMSRLDPGGQLIGVYTSRELAEAACTLISETKRKWNFIEIEEISADQEVLIYY
jgi:hypothetical protein